MRQFVLRGVMIVVLAAMFGGHVTELFDRWDHTARTGKDIDYAVVIVSGCIGVAFVAVKKLISTPLAGFIATPLAIPIRSSGGCLVAASASTGPSPPLLGPLRI